MVLALSVYSAYSGVYGIYGIIQHKYHNLDRPQNQCVVQFAMDMVVIAAVGFLQSLYGMYQEMYLMFFLAVLI